MVRMTILLFLLLFDLGCGGQGSTSNLSASNNAETTANQKIEEEKLRTLKEIEKNTREMKESSDRRESEKLSSDMNRTIKELQANTAELEQIERARKRVQKLSQEVDANYKKWVKETEKSQNAKKNQDNRSTQPAPNRP